MTHKVIRYIVLWSEYTVVGPCSAKEAEPLLFHTLCVTCPYPHRRIDSDIFMQQHVMGADNCTLTSAGGPCQRALPDSSLQPSTGLCWGEGRLGPGRSCLGSGAYVLKPVPIPSSPAFCTTCRSPLSVLRHAFPMR